MNMKQIQAPIFQRGQLRDYQKLAHFLACLGSKVVAVTDTTVAPLHAIHFCAGLQPQGLSCRLIAIPPGEQTKSRHMKAELEDALFADNMGRDSVLIAMGGGVILDLVGFVASTYCRGIALVLIPTTLLAMCDAAIGGKTGVNVPGGKNRIGTFYPADGIWVDPEMLTTLPMLHRQEGIVEMIKHALIAEPEAFVFLEGHLDAILALDPFTLDVALKQSIKVKQRIVEEDLEENGIRATLNFGHTIGHAIEAESGYTISHGSAVAMGIAIEARLSREYAGLSQTEVERIDQLLMRLRLLNHAWETLESQKLFSAMQHDKKNRQGVIHCVLLEALGKVARHGCAFTHPLSFKQLEVGIDAWKQERPQGEIYGLCNPNPNMLHAL